MKSLMTTLLLSIICLAETFATVRTVSNDPAVPAQYATVQAAVDASAAGDTVYVNGSELNYTEDVYIRRKLVLIGAGFNPNKQNRYRTYINSVWLERTTVIAQDPSGSSISGIYTNGIYIYRVNNTVSIVTNISITKCYVADITIGYYPGQFVPTYGGVNDVLVMHNMVGALEFPAGSWTTSSGSNFIIRNNVIDYVNRLNSSSAIFSNNIIGRFVHTTKNAVFNNNIILGDYKNQFSGQQNINPTFYQDVAYYEVASGIANNSFSNNITYSSNLFQSPQYYNPSNSLVNNYFFNTTTNGVNSGDGNQVGVDPLFENVDFTKDWNYIFNDFRLKSNSPGKNAGTDGTDIGIYGGTNPWPDGGEPGSGFQLSPLPEIPQIKYMNIKNAVISSGGTLEVEVKATKN